MLMPSDIGRRLRREYYQWRHAQQVTAIADTAPLERGRLPFLVLSMVQRVDLLSYLVAVKSLAAYANPARIVVVCDPSMQPADRTVLRQHIPHIELRDAAQFRHRLLPAGGCWERLQAICEYARHAYVVQLDADTVTLALPGAVIDSITSKTGFVLAGESDQVLMTLEETADLSRTTYPGNPHIQCILERAMPHAALPAGSRYVRGCAAFTGFPQTPHMATRLLDFSQAMQVVVGARWRDWGTEQGASNYLVANAAGTELLPFPAYGTPDVMDAQSVFVHFIGDMRFTSDRYRDATVRAILQQQSARP